MGKGERHMQSAQQHSQLIQVLGELCDYFGTLGLPAQHYLIPGYTGYESINCVPSTNVYCLEVRLGAAHQKPNYSTYAVAQIVDFQHPNLALITLIERHDHSGELATSVPVYNRVIDHAFSYHFLPTMHTAFNVLDPTAQNCSLLVQLYNARITLPDLPPASVATVKLMRRFKRDGQLAQIAVDFEDPLTVFIAKMVGPLTANNDVYYLPRTEKPSMISVPVRGHGDKIYLIRNLSNALDDGFAIAYRYLAAHHARYTDKQANPFLVSAELVPEGR
jgi:hypothetical protein